MSRPGRARRVATRVASVCLAAVLLAACRVDSAVDLRVEPNGSGDVTVTVTADAAVLAAVPDLAADVRVDDLERAGWEVDGPDETDDGGLRVVLRRSFDDPAGATAVLAQLNGAAGPLRDVKVERSGKDTNSVWTLTGALQVTGGLGAFIDETAAGLLGEAPFEGDVAAAGLELGEAVGIEFTAVLPGKVDATTGVAGEEGITWRVPMDGSTTDIATTVTNVDVAASVAGVATGVLRFLLALWIAATLALLAAVWVKNRPRTPRI